MAETERRKRKQTPKKRIPAQSTQLVQSVQQPIQQPIQQPVQSQSDDFDCTLCYGPMICNVTSNCCGNMCCYNCYQHLTDKHKCPFCNHKSSFTHVIGYEDLFLKAHPEHRKDSEERVRKFNESRSSSSPGSGMSTHVSVGTNTDHDYLHRYITLFGQQYIHPQDNLRNPMYVQYIPYAHLLLNRVCNICMRTNCTEHGYRRF